MKPWLRITRDGREILNTKMVLGLKEYRARVAEMLERQGGMCCLYGHIDGCPGPLRLEEATFEHEHGRGAGGGKRDDRTTLPDGRWVNGAAHYLCNAAKGSRYIPYNCQSEQRRKRNGETE